MKSRFLLGWLFLPPSGLFLRNLVVRADLVGIPTVPFTSAGGGTLNIQDLKTIVVDQQFANATDTNGETLIPPTLLEFASLFRSDLLALGIDLPVNTAPLSSHVQDGSLVLTLASNSGFVDAAGRNTSEAYALNVAEDSIMVAGSSPLGVWWGTRSLLQQITLGDGSIPLGTGVDSPGWGTRGVMLDGGRHFFPTDFLKELCAYISYFKQNTLHLHLSDNLFNNPDYTPEQRANLYAAFRFNSTSANLQGLARRPNETYSRSDFDDLQQSCASRGVTVIPEIEAPGHALVITQWKPELALSSDASLLNITFPETIPTMELIWQEFLPWFHCKTVHIGADEYDSSLADDYNLFVNTMSSFILQQSGKDIRIWGTNEPGKHSNVSTNITIQHWEFFEDNPFHELLQNGYRVLNSDDGFYIVEGFSTSYPQSLNVTRIFHGDPSVPGGGPFAPNIFDINNATNNPSRSHPGVVGHIAAQWNDFGPNATTFLQAFYDWEGGLPALADKQWGGSLTQAMYTSLVPLIQGGDTKKIPIPIPGQNLARVIKSKTATILNYTFAAADIVRDGQGRAMLIRDRSGNGYHAQVHNATISNGTISFSGPGSFLTTPLGSKGFTYSLSFSIRPTASAAAAGIGTILSSTDAQLLNGPAGQGGNAPFHNLTLFTSGNYYSLNYSLPLSAWTKLTLIGRSDLSTTLLVESPNGILEEMRFLTTIGVNGQSKVWKDIPVVAPLTQIGGFVGQMKDILLLDSA